MSKAIDKAIAEGLEITFMDHGTGVGVPPVKRTVRPVRRRGAWVTVQGERWRSEQNTALWHDIEIVPHPSTDNRSGDKHSPKGNDANA